jgi:hypothetical protein
LTFDIEHFPVRWRVLEKGRILGLREVVVRAYIP